MMGVSEIFKDTEYSCHTEVTTLKHDFAIIVFASSAPSWFFAMRINTKLLMLRTSLFPHFAGYSRSYSNALVNSSLNQYARQVDDHITFGSNSAEIYILAVIRIDDERQVCDRYEQHGCNSWQGGGGGSPIQYGSNGKPVLVHVISLDA